MLPRRDNLLRRGQCVTQKRTVYYRGEDSVTEERTVYY